MLYARWTITSDGMHKEPNATRVVQNSQAVGGDSN